MTGRFPIEDVMPVVAGGDYAAKAVVGEHVPISAVSYREGHDALGMTVAWRGPDGPKPAVRLSPGAPGTDTWQGTIQPDAVGAWEFSVESFSDPYLTWRHAVIAKIDAGQGPEDLANDLAKGAAIFDLAIKGAPDEYAAELTAAADALRDSTADLGDRVEPAIDLAPVLWDYPVRELVTASAAYPLWVDRDLALFSAWYEMFPR
ncbi:MAG TPA: maltotransferase domain-containing protein, partial [Micromonosporaceae bacterium]